MSGMYLEYPVGSCNLLKSPKIWRVMIGSGRLTRKDGE